MAAETAHRIESPSTAPLMRTTRVRSPEPMCLKNLETTTSTTMKVSAAEAAKSRTGRAAFDGCWVETSPKAAVMLTEKP